MARGDICLPPEASASLIDNWGKWYQSLRVAELSSMPLLPCLLRIVRFSSGGYKVDLQLPL